MPRGDERVTGGGPRWSESALVFPGPADDGPREVSPTFRKTPKGPESAHRTPAPTPSTCRGDRIRTCDPLVPNQVLYQAEPLPEADTPHFEGRHSVTDGHPRGQPLEGRDRPRADRPPHPT